MAGHCPPELMLFQVCPCQSSTGVLYWMTNKERVVHPHREGFRQIAQGREALSDVPHALCHPLKATATLVLIAWSGAILWGRNWVEKRKMKGIVGASGLWQSGVRGDRCWFWCKSWEGHSFPLFAHGHLSLLKLYILSKVIGSP